MGRGRLPGRRTQTLVDVLLLVWTVLWVVAGVAVAREMRGLAEISDTVSTVGQATTTLGDTLRTLPLVGESLEEPAEQLAAAGTEAVQSARAARDSARALGTLLGVSIALIPTLPALLLYLPQRLTGARERRALNRALARGREPWVDEMLARRAIVHLPYHRLRRVTDDPLGDLRAGRYAELAAAELEWHGIHGREAGTRRRAG